ncbi:MAG: DNA repair protein RecO [Elusimicrobia bacterium]|nr:DNA repair protein RecO [Elusimicrobiota bacterium]
MVMYFCDAGIVVRRRCLRESDRLAVIYTRLHGKLEVNFKSAALARAKLKVLSEPLTWGDYRFYTRPGSPYPVCTGGSTLSVFPFLRSDMENLCMALHFSELLSKLTPYNQPNEDKYLLMLGCLKYLNVRKTSAWIRPAFILRLMETAGFGYKNTFVGIKADIWDTLHAGAWEEVDSLPENPPVFNSLNAIIDEFLAEHIPGAVKTEKIVALSIPA